MEDFCAFPGHEDVLLRESFLLREVNLHRIQHIRSHRCYLRR